MTKFIDLFAGIGGFHLAFKSLGAECVFVCENDKFARETYIANHGYQCVAEVYEKGNFAGYLGTNFPKDINNVDISQIPNFDILCAGFPCQSFSVIGKSKGFDCEKNGNLFFRITDILKEKQPEAFFLENVRGLLSNDEGKTFETIKQTIRDLGYSFYWKLIKASDHGLPQFRPRVYMVGFKDKSIDFTFPEPVSLKFTMSDVLGGNCTRDVGYTVRVSGRGTLINDRRNWDGYIVDGLERRLTVEETKKMMGFADNFTFPVSDTQAMKQLGNSVAIDVIQVIGKQIMKCLNERK